MALIKGAIAFPKRCRSIMGAIVFPQAAQFYPGRHCPHQAAQFYPERWPSVPFFGRSRPKNAQKPPHFC